VIELRSPTELVEMQAAGRFVAETLTELMARVDVGTNLLEVDAEAHRLIRESGATSCYLDYHPSFGGSPFGKVICTSVNDAVLHGLPHDYRLVGGDLLTLDFAISLGGWVSDSAVSVVVGEADPADLKLIDTVNDALTAGIGAAGVGRRLGDVGAAISAVARRAGYSVNTTFGGHGVGRTMHGEPHVPNDGRPKRGLTLSPGLVIAIEPWLLGSTDRIYTDDDGWTLRSTDGSRGAHAEHTVAVTEAGPLVLTARPDGLGVPPNAVLPRGAA